MNSGEIDLPLGVKEFGAGAMISGVARWSLDKQPSEGVINFFWYVEQRDGPHVFLVDSLTLQNPQMQGEQEFSFQSPDGPFSYHGELFSINWALELLIEPDILDIREKIVVAPAGMPVAWPDGQNRKP